MDPKDRLIKFWSHGRAQSSHKGPDVNNNDGDPLDNLIRRIQQHPENIVLDPPSCKYRRCPFCVGSLMAQRYVLSERLVQLDNLFFGRPEIDSR